MIFEHFFQCPHCWQEISMLLDSSVTRQKYIEDCEVCCNPLEIRLMFHHGELTEFSVQKTS